MGAKYTDAQRKASEKYLKEKYARINIALRKEDRELFKQAADKAGMSLNGFIIESVKMRIKDIEEQ